MTEDRVLPPPPERLTEDLWHEFLDAIARAGGHLADYLMPPLPAREVRRLVHEGTGLTLPDEAALWWSLHNGTSPSPYYKLLPRAQVIGVEVAVEWCRILRNVSALCVVDAMHDDLVAVPRFEVWWFPILDADGDVLICDVGVRPWEASPIRRHEHSGDAFEHHRIRARSIGEMVRRWIVAVDDGWYRFDDSTGFWEPSYFEEMTRWDKARGFL